MKKLLFSPGTAPNLSTGYISYPKFITIAGVFLALRSSRQTSPAARSAGLPEVPHSPAPSEGPSSIVQRRPRNLTWGASRDCDQAPRPVPMQSASRLQLSTQTGMACVFLQESGQLGPGSVVHFDPESVGRCLPPLLPLWDTYCYRNTPKKLVGMRAEESFAPDLAAACTTDMMLRCLPAGLILQATPHPRSIPSETLEAASPFFIKAGIGLSGLPSAPRRSLPARVPCQALAGLGLISGGFAPAMETGGGCCSGARRGAAVRPQGGGGKSFWIVPLPPRPCFCGDNG